MSMKLGMILTFYGNKYLIVVSMSVKFVLMRSLESS